MDFNPLKIPEIAIQFGFSDRLTGGHMARSMMLSELRLLLASVPMDANREDYRCAIIHDNILGKPTFSSRGKSDRHLRELYGLDPSLALFRTLRRFAAEDDDSLPLLALACVFCRDQQIRASFPVIEQLKTGEVLPRIVMEEHLEGAFPDRFSPIMKSSMAKNCNATWTAAGHLLGRSVKRKAIPTPRVMASTYAMFAGYLLGLRGEMLVNSVFARLVGAEASLVVTHLATASRNGWLRFRHAGGVMEIDFSNLLRPEEEVLLNGSH